MSSYRPAHVPEETGTAPGEWKNGDMVIFTRVVRTPKGAEWTDRIIFLRECGVWDPYSVGGLEDCVDTDADMDAKIVNYLATGGKVSVITETRELVHE
jgi:hypothetical protein